MRLALATVGGHPTDPRVWSGTPANLVPALASQVAHLELVGPVGRGTYFAGRALSSSTRRVGHKVSWEVEPVFLRRLTADLATRLAAVDAVDAVVALGWTPYSANPLSTPTVYWGDATFAQRVDDAPHWSALGRRTRGRLELVEGEVLRSMHQIVMPSHWAADDVVGRYDVDPERVHVVPFGASVDVPRAIHRNQLADPIRLLLVGVEWHRKGVDRAVLIADELRQRGLNVLLDVVGVHPPSHDWHRDYVTYHGVVSKAAPSGAAQLSRLYTDADLFILPTRSDPFPVVLGEAAAYSLPAIASSVGGVPERVKDGSTGLLMPPSSTSIDWADAVVRLHANSALYRHLASGARRYFEREANWECAAERLAEVVMSSM